MKRPDWACSISKTLGLWHILLLAVIHWLPLANAASDSMIVISHAEVLYSDRPDIPPSEARWRPVDLPHRTAKPTDRELVSYWYRATFDYAGNQPLWLYFPKLRSGGAIFMNGIKINDIRSADASHQVRWFHPHLSFVPPLSLQQGTNQIAVHFAIREPLTSFGAFSIGAQRPIRAAYEQRLLWEVTSTEIASMACGIGGVLIMVFWLRRREETLYGVLGACVLLWGIRTFVFRMPEIPMTWWVIWRFFYYLTTAGFITCITLFLLMFSGFARPWLQRTLVANWLGGSLLFLVFGAAARPFMDAVWMLSFLPFTLFSLACLALSTWRQPRLESVGMMLAILLTLALAIHDYAVQHGLFGLSEFYLLHLGIPAILAVMTCMLMNRLVHSLQQSGSIHEQLAQRVAIRERELDTSHRLLNQLTREHATVTERQRIMQDMHDGVGSQLLSTLVIVQRGNASQAAMVELLRDCLDDMRLSIDALSPDEPDLLTALGDFRVRITSRFRHCGLELNWRNKAMPDTLQVAPHIGLQVLRILQEALANVIKHAQATKVEVDVIFSAASLTIRILDDGIGLAARDGAATGRGLINMRARAGKLGATLLVEQPAKGTLVIFAVPIRNLTTGLSNEDAVLKEIEASR